MNLANANFEVQRLGNETANRLSRGVSDSIEDSQSGSEFGQRNTLRDYILVPGQEIEYAIKDIH